MAPDDIKSCNRVSFQKIFNFSNLSLFGLRNYEKLNSYFLISDREAQIRVRSEGRPNEKEVKEKFSFRILYLRYF